MPTTCLKTISQTDESDLNLGIETRVEMTTLKAIMSKIRLVDWKYAAQITADPANSAKNWKLVAVIFWSLFSTMRKYSHSAIIHMTLITTASHNVPPKPMSKIRKGTSTSAVIHRFKCMIKLVRFAHNWNVWIMEQWNNGKISLNPATKNHNQ